MILSLLLATIIVVPTIALVGISPVGMDLLGSKGTATHTANATFWNVYSSFGLSIIIPLVIGGTILVVLLIVVIQKIDHKKLGDYS